MTAKIGDNNPPDEFEIIKGEINDLYHEAKGFLDGEAIKTQGEADSLEKLVKMIKKADKTAEALRKAEVAPLDNAKRKIQDKFAPLNGKPKANSSAGKTILAINALNKTITPWKNELQRLKDEKAEKLRKEAEEKAELAQMAAQSTNLEEQEAAQDLMNESQKLAKASKRESKDTVKGMRKVYRARMIHPKDAFTYYWNSRREDIIDFIQKMADSEVCEANQNIPGFEIILEKVAK